MTSSFLTVFNPAYVALFWVFLFTRLLVMRKRGITVLFVTPKSVGFLGGVAAWSGLFIYLTYYPSEFLLFRPLWSVSADAGIALTWTGVALAVVGQTLLWVAIVTMGKSWRIELDEENPDELITHGVFGLSRNPIFVGAHAVAAAAFLIQPNVTFLVYAVAQVVGVHLQILNEERFLAKTYGDAYAEYRERVPRYFLFE